MKAREVAVKAREEAVAAKEAAVKEVDDAWDQVHVVRRQVEELAEKNRRDLAEREEAVNLSWQKKRIELVEREEVVKIAWQEIYRARKQVDDARVANAAAPVNDAAMKVDED